MIKVNINGERISLPCDAGNVSDGYHTFDELYDHRCALYLAFLFYHADHHGGWKSRCHQDGSSFDGWFIVGTTLNGKQISYHLPEKLWDYAWWLTEYDRAPEWDGHTSQDVVERLLSFVGRSR